MGISIAAARTPERVLENAGPRSSGFGWQLVQIAERTAALIALAGIAPLLLISAIVVFLLSHASPFVAHSRAGLRGRRIWVLKLRTMWGNATSAPGQTGIIQRLSNTPVPQFKNCNDPRITSSFAAFCRRYSIDEMPQLWQVVRGEMALVGPRPLTTEELSVWYGADADEVLALRPGITGLWQVMGRNSLTYRQRRTLDLYLVRHWSFRLYLSILINTLPAVLTARNAG